VEESKSAMIIRSLRSYWPVRKIEWIMAGFLASWGMYILLHPAIFYSPATAKAYAGLAYLSSGLHPNPAFVWGSAALLIGSLRGLALFINGAYTRTPLIRLMTSFASMFIVTQIVIGLWQSGVSNPGLIAYSWFVIADLTAAHMSAIDVALAEKRRHELKGSRRGRSDFTGITA
jgi:hypothetical protein